MPKKTLTIFLTVLTIALFAATVSSAEDSVLPETFHIRWFSDVPYISLVEIAEAYGLRIESDPGSQSMKLTRGTGEVRFAHLMRTATVNGSPHTMPLPARMVRGAVYVPATVSLRHISSLLPGTLNWDDARKTVTVGDALGSVKSVECTNKDNGSLIKIHLNEKLACSAEMKQERMLSLTLKDAVYVRQSDFLTVDSPMIESTASNQRPDGAEITFFLSENAGDYDLIDTGDGQTVTLSIRSRRNVSAPLPAADSGDFMLLPEFRNDMLQNMRIDTVVIDAGHGGKDPGAVGPKNTQEKDIVLDVAKELKKIIDKSGEVQAVMTRDRDVFVPLHQRAKIAREAGGKLFISLHANANRNTHARGIEVYFLSEAKTEAAKEVASRENKAIELEENQEFYANFTNVSDIEYNFSDMWSNVYMTDSQHFSSLVLEKCCQATQLSMRGVKQAPFYVMLGTQAMMPSILVEIGFISNPEEERLLKRGTYQKKIAQAIYDAVLMFKKEVEKNKFSGG